MWSPELLPTITPTALSFEGKCPPPGGVREFYGGKGVSEDSPAPCTAAFSLAAVSESQISQCCHTAAEGGGQGSRPTTDTSPLGNHVF